MRRVNRKTRLAIVLAIAIVSVVVAWRTSERGGLPPCKENRTEEKDTSGKVVRITRTHCPQG
jgi:hypothetical protein